MCLCVCGYDLNWDSRVLVFCIVCLTVCVCVCVFVCVCRHVCI